MPGGRQPEFPSHEPRRASPRQNVGLPRFGKGGTAVAAAGLCVFGSRYLLPVSDVGLRGEFLFHLWDDSADGARGVWPRSGPGTGRVGSAVLFHWEGSLCEGVC